MPPINAAQGGFCALRLVGAVRPPVAPPASVSVLAAPGLQETPVLLRTAEGQGHAVVYPESLQVSMSPRQWELYICDASRRLRHLRSGGESGCYISSAGPWHKAKAGAARGCGGILSRGSSDEKGLGARALTGWISVVSDWRPPGLCDAACLCTKSTTPNPSIRGPVGLPQKRLSPFGGCNPPALSTALLSCTLTLGLGLPWMSGMPWSAKCLRFFRSMMRVRGC